MQNRRFVVLSGHLSNYPLSDLVGILRHQRKTGRLTIEYPKSPGTFFFHNGELVDAQLNNLTGLQAICMALAQPEAAFNFNPLIPPSRRTIASSLQRVASELIGCWDESNLQIEGMGTATNSEYSSPTTQFISNTPQSISPGNRRPLPRLPASPIDEGMGTATNSERACPTTQFISNTPQSISPGNRRPLPRLPAAPIDEGTGTATNSERSSPTTPFISNTLQSISPGNRRPLPRLPAAPIGIQRRSLLFVAAAAVLIMGLATVITLSGRLNSARVVSEGMPSETTFGAAPKSTQTEKHAGTKEASKAARKSQQLARQVNRVSTVRSESDQSDSTTGLSSQTASAPSNAQAKPAANSIANPQSITVVMQIENGRVLKASIADHKPGMDSYEGLALRVAKQRRYSSKVTGQESVKINVSRPN
jgi:hypothetical protein